MKELANELIGKYLCCRVANMQEDQFEEYYIHPTEVQIDDSDELHIFAPETYVKITPFDEDHVHFDVLEEYLYHWIEFETLNPDTDEATFVEINQDEWMRETEIIKENFFQ